MEIFRYVAKTTGTGSFELVPASVAHQPQVIEADIEWISIPSPCVCDIVRDFVIFLNGRILALLKQALATSITFAIGLI